MSAVVATREPRSPADAASPEGGTDGAPTPVYDHLMSMIQATALENATRAVPQNDDFEAAPASAGRRRRLLIACAAAVIVAGGALFVSGVSLRDPLVVAADSASEKASLVAGTAATTEVPVERPIPAPELGGQTPIGADEMKTAEAGIGAATVPPAASDDQPAAPPPAEKPDESPGSGVETQSDSVASAPASLASTEAMLTGSVAPAASEGAVREDAPASPPPAVSDTWSTVEQVDAPAATQMARIVSDVSMRAGPGNGKAVLATIPRGTRVEVIGCRAWCEVIFTGQRGWVYKSFIGAPSIAGER